MFMPFFFFSFFFLVFVVDYIFLFGRGAVGRCFCSFTSRFSDEMINNSEIEAIASEICLRVTASYLLNVIL